MKQLEEFQDCAEMLKAVADPDRLRIVQLLFDGGKTVSVIADDLDEDITKVSHHLGILRRSKIVQATKEGRFVKYSVHPLVKSKSSSSGKRQINFGCCRLDLDS